MQKMYVFRVRSQQKPQTRKNKKCAVSVTAEPKTKGKAVGVTAEQKMKKTSMKRNEVELTAEPSTNNGNSVITQDAKNDSTIEAINIGFHGREEVEKSLPSGSKLLTQRRTHKGDKSLICDICQKGYSYPMNLKMHKLIHTRECVNYCSLCQKTFPTKARLEIHVRTHTGEIPFSCDSCHRSFASKRNLSRHKRLHQNVNKAYKYIAFVFKNFHLNAD